MVSVPYWGLDFLIKKDCIEEYERDVSVPYWGLDFLIKIGLDKDSRAGSFRPLLGIRFFDRDTMDIKAYNNLVSVPYWGLDFLIMKQLSMKQIIICFRPLLGIRFFDIMKYPKIWDGKQCFRPLLGIRFFDQNRFCIYISDYVVSVPYWGLDFLIQEV